MDNPKTFLLKKIMGYETNGLKSLGQLHAKHIDDLTKVLLQFAEETVIEVIDIINKGQNVDMNEIILSVKTVKTKQLK